ncbi:MAG: helix-turn-helix domain-containing protein [Oscillospiraceae bacterium]|nr:helix-turn-helix domain-containing protein [Oscillospiraceae bacterium]
MLNEEKIIDLTGGTNVNDRSIFYSTSDVAEMLGCSEAAAREIMRRADFPLIKVGKNYKVFKPAFEKWAMQRRE